MASSQDGPADIDLDPDRDGPADIDLDPDRVLDGDAFVVEAIEDDSSEVAEEEHELAEPKKGMIFDNMDDAFLFYKRYARRRGFAITRRSSRTGQDEKIVKYFTLACNRQGKAQYSSKNTFKPNPSARMDCPAKLNFALHGLDKKYRLSSLTLEHNHDLSPGKARFLRCHKKIDLAAQRKLDLNDRAGIRVNKNFHSLVVEAGGYENLQFGEKECRNYLQEKRRLKLGAGDADAVYQYFLRMQSKNSNFFYVMDLDDKSRLRNVFWADARSRAAYESFSDVVTFDTTYLTNKYDMPFAPFIGVNHHGESILLGCGLLSNEDTETFVWLFKSWLACMSKKSPKAIITDQSKAMQNAIEIVFPHTRHRWCLWHIMEKIPKKLCGYSKYEDIKSTLSNVVYDSLTKSDFEKDWIQMINTYGLQENEWLSGLYINRHKWVPVYVKDTFWAGMSTTQRSESINAFFDGYVNSRTTLSQFADQYDNALRDKVEKENKADAKSFHESIPCISHYEVEKQFQSAYTNAKFKEFQDQLRGKLYCYPTLLKEEGSFYTFKVTQDVKIREQEVSLDFSVSINTQECDVKCICHHFEFRGILCSHILSILPVMKIKEVPNKYILHRWRKDLKRKHTFIKSSYDDSIATPVAIRYDELCKSFSEVAEDGAESDALFDFVINGIRELKVKTIAARHNIHQAQESDPLNREDDGMPDQSNAILNPIPVRKMGRPPSVRKESKTDKIVRKMREKQKGASRRPTGSQKGRRKKVTPGEHELISTPCNGNMSANFQSSEQTVPTAPTASKPTLPCDISSYVDLLQGNGDLTHLLSPDMNI